MASIGHWKDLTEAEKLTQNVLVSGIIEENIKNGGILGLLPAAQFSGKAANWNRESTIPASQRIAIGGQLSWQDAAEVDQKETGLKN